MLDTDHGKPLRNAVLWAANEPQALAVTGPRIAGCVNLAAKDSMTVRLVNLTNPMAMKGPLREILPLSGQRVGVRLPPGKQVTKVQFLVSGAPPSLAPDGNTAYINVPSSICTR